MAKRTYPRNVWVLLPSLKPKMVEVIKRYSSYSHHDYGDVTITGKIYAVEAMFDSFSEAIDEAERKLEAGRADIAKRQLSLDKRAATVAKALAGK